MKTAVLDAVECCRACDRGGYVIPTAGKAVAGFGGPKNSVAMDDATGALLKAILEKAAPRTVVLAMGNPYVVQSFPEIENYLCAFSNMSVSETAAVKAVFGEIPIRGHLPVTIPDVAARGEGLERPAQLSSGGSAYAQP